MSEKHIPLHDAEKTPNDASAEQRNDRLDELKQRSENSRHEHAEHIDEIRKQIEKEASNTSEESTVRSLEDEPETPSTYWYSKEYREVSFKQFMGKVRTKLSKSERVTSKIIHNPTVEQLSEIGSKTVARPSGVLFGSIFSFISSTLTYYFARKNGYDMTYSIFFASFIGGFLVGVLAEFSMRAIRTIFSRK